jgi:hypothetical protein
MALVWRTPMSENPDVGHPEFWRSGQNAGVLRFAQNDTLLNSTGMDFTDVNFADGNPGNVQLIVLMARSLFGGCLRARGLRLGA